MTTISTGTATVDGVGVRGACLGGEVHKGLPTERGGGRVNAAMDDALREIAAIDDGVATFAVRAELTVHPTWPTSGPSRSGEPARRKDEEPRLLLDGPALEPGEVGQIAMVEEDGILRFVLPMEGTRNQFDIPLGDSLAADGPGERGLSFRAAALAIRVVGVLGGRKLANAGFRMGVRAIEDRTRPPRAPNVPEHRVPQEARRADSADVRVGAVGAAPPPRHQQLQPQLLPLLDRLRAGHGEAVRAVG